MLRSLLGRMVIASGALLVLTPPSALTRPVDDLLFTRHDGLSGAGSTLLRWIEDARLHGLDLELAPDVRAWMAGADGDFTRQRELSWEYRFTDAWGYRAFFYVNFDPRGVVVSKFTRRLENDRFPFR